MIPRMAGLGQRRAPSPTMPSFSSTDGMGNRSFGIPRHAHAPPDGPHRATSRLPAMLSRTEMATQLVIYIPSTSAPMDCGKCSSSWPCIDPLSETECTGHAPMDCGKSRGQGPRRNGIGNDSAHDSGFLARGCNNNGAGSTVRTTSSRNFFAGDNNNDNATLATAQQHVPGQAPAERESNSCSSAAALQGQAPAR